MSRQSKDSDSDNKKIKRIENKYLLAYFAARSSANKQSEAAPLQQVQQLQQLMVSQASGIQQSKSSQSGVRENKSIKPLAKQVDTMRNPNEQQQTQSSPPHQSPSSQHLSYRQQQQLHQQQIQRTGGIQRLTADLAGLQFNDVDDVLRRQQQPVTAQLQATARSHHIKHHRHGKRVVRSPRDGSKSSKKTIGTVVQSEPPPSQAALEQQPPPTEVHKRNIDIAVGQVIAGGGYEEQMIVSTGSQGSDYDPAKDALETADDANFLKRFKIVNLVGTGNYARVYKCVSPSGKELAIKAINLSKTSDNYKLKFLPRELTILKRVNHVNICKTHEILHVADRVFIMMQFCSRGTIADLLHRVGPLSEPVTRNLFIQILDAVMYMHSIDIAHRDLKVENILLDQDFCPKLTDFSYSVFTSNSQQVDNKNNWTGNDGKMVATGRSTKANRARISSIKLNETFCGTLPYLSPEMIRQHPYDSKKTDIWSLGVCLYVMLNDRLPFPFSDIKIMVKRQLTKDYKFKTTLEFSEQVKELMSQVLEPDSTKRLTCYELSKHPWMNGLREKPPP